MTSSAPVNPFKPFAETNFSLSGASGLYDRARPRYPPAALSQIVDTLPTSSTVVELGSGTGIFSRMLITAAQEKHKLKKLVCVEPAEGMRKGFADKLSEVKVKDSVEVTVVDGAFDQIPETDASADLIVAAQAFHWIGHDGESAIKEFARVLKPGGSLALIWNLEDRNRAAWVSNIRDVYEMHEAGTPQYRHGYWKHIFDLPIYKSSFAEPTIGKFHQDIPNTEQLAIDRILSKSYVTALSEEEQARVEKDARVIIQKGEGMKWIDKQKGIFEYPYETDLYLIKRL